MRLFAVVKSDQVLIAVSLFMISVSGGEEKLFQRKYDLRLRPNGMVSGIRSTFDCALECFNMHPPCVAFAYTTPHCFTSAMLGFKEQAEIPTYRVVGYCPDPYMYNPISKTCFRLVNETLSWYDADQKCRDEGEYLVTFPTGASSDWFIQKALELAVEMPGIAWEKYLWIGAVEEGDQLIWKGLITGEVKEKRYCREEPNKATENCTLIGAQVNGWADANCNSTLRFLCETDL